MQTTIARVGEIGGQIVGACKCRLSEGGYKKAANDPSSRWDDEGSLGPIERPTHANCCVSLCVLPVHFRRGPAGSEIITIWPDTEGNDDDDYDGKFVYPGLCLSVPGVCWRECMCMCRNELISHHIIS